MKQDWQDRFWVKVSVGAHDECWPWHAVLDRDGYGKFYLAGSRTVLAHRVAYERLLGPIPEGLVIDHLCRNRRCQNPLHMEPVTMAENKRRGESFSIKNAKKTHCPQGHPYDGINTYIHPSTGYRHCRECKRVRDRVGYIPLDAAGKAVK